MLATLLIMMEAVRPGELDRYQAMIREFVTTYGAVCWPTTHQADVRCRQERMRPLRRQGMHMHNADDAAAIAAGFDVAHPWRYVWRASLTDTAFWHKEVHLKCMLLITGVAREELDGDVLGFAPTSCCSRYQPCDQGP